MDAQEAQQAFAPPSPQLGPRRSPWLPEAAAHSPSSLGLDIVKRVLSLALDRGAQSDREQLAALLSALELRGVVSHRHIEDGLRALLFRPGRFRELRLDQPRAVQYLAELMAYLILDDALGEAFLFMDHRAAEAVATIPLATPRPSGFGMSAPAQGPAGDLDFGGWSEVRAATLALLESPTPLPLAQARSIYRDIIAAYLLPLQYLHGGSATAAASAVPCPLSLAAAQTALATIGARHTLPEAVRKAVQMSVSDCPSDPRAAALAHEAASEFLLALRDTGSLPPAAVEEGFLRLLRGAADLRLDHPRALHILAGFVARAVRDGLLASDFLDTLPPALSGVTPAYLAPPPTPASASSSAQAPAVAAGGTTGSSSSSSGGLGLEAFRLDDGAAPARAPLAFPTSPLRSLTAARSSVAERGPDGTWVNVPSPGSASSAAAAAAGAAGAAPPPRSTSGFFAPSVAAHTNGGASGKSSVNGSTGSFVDVSLPLPSPESDATAAELALDHAAPSGTPSPTADTARDYERMTRASATAVTHARALLPSDVALYGLSAEGLAGGFDLKLARVWGYRGRPLRVLRADALVLAEDFVADVRQGCADADTELAARLRSAAAALAGEGDDGEPDQGAAEYVCVEAVEALVVEAISIAVDATPSVPVAEAEQVLQRTLALLLSLRQSEIVSDAALRLGLARARSALDSESTEPEDGAPQEGFIDGVRAGSTFAHAIAQLFHKGALSAHAANVLAFRAPGSITAVGSGATGPRSRVSSMTIVVAAAGGQASPTVSFGSAFTETVSRTFALLANA
jgi:hypothetical protein